MSTQTFLQCLFCLFISLTASSSKAQQIGKSITLQFNKIKPNVEEFNTAEMKASFTEDSNMINLQFAVPNYILRYKTTTADYVILETANETVTLQNEIETDVAKGFISLNLILSQNYTFACSMPKDNFIKLLKDKIQKIIFCFAPNEDFIKSKLAKEKFFDKVAVNFIRFHASNTVKYHASQPDLFQYEKLILWSNELH